MQAPGQVQQKVPKVPVKVWEALLQSQVTFNGGSGEGSGEGLGGFGAEPVVQSQVRFNRVLAKVPGEGAGGFGAESG